MEKGGNQRLLANTREDKRWPTDWEHIRSWKASRLKIETRQVDQPSETLGRILEN